MQKELKRYVWAFGVLGVLIIITALISMLASNNAPSNAIAQSAFPASAPAPRAVDAVSAQKGFNALVSFTGGAFEPSIVTIHTGQTIRFSDNASAPLQLASFDSSFFAGAGVIASRSYAEVTFSQSGQFRYTDARSGASGAIVVQ